MSKLSRALLGSMMIVGIALGLVSPASASSYNYQGQCVPFARMVSGIDLRGNAHTWWAQAEGRYARGDTPRVGSVMVLKAFRAMRVGHVAMVSQIVDARTIRITHANWSVINGRRGQVEENVVAVDTSANNDWSQVRVWYAPMQGVGLTSYPVAGFIYNEPEHNRGTVVMAANTGAVHAAAAAHGQVSTLR